MDELKRRLLQLLLLLLPHCCSCSLGEIQQAMIPPRGWNSYDAYSWTISEEEFIQNAQVVAERLKIRRYEYVVVDYLWYRKKVDGADANSRGFDVIDEWGRLIPDPSRWPSSRNGKGFTDIAKKVHAMGLKFGFHVMGGISTEAYDANTPILDITTGKQYEDLGKKWSAQDVGTPERACSWMKNGFMSVNTTLGAGQAFLRSLYQQYYDWGVDFVKHDCVFGDDFNLDEITFVSSVLGKFDRTIVYSLSPGSNVTPDMAKKVSGLANMYRVTADDWDKWPDVAAHFNIARDLADASLIGTKGLRGNSWPDLDMLPFGLLTDPAANEGPHRISDLSMDEQKTQMTFWAMTKSPLMFGGDMRHFNDTLSYLVNEPAVVDINAYSSNNQEFFYFSTSKLSETRKFRDHMTQHKSKEETLTLVLTSCNHLNARGWSAKAIDNDDEQVCWRKALSKGNKEPFCLHKRKPVLPLDELVTYEQLYDGKVHLFNMKMPTSCLSASNRMHTSKEIKRGSFSPCKMDANQMWELNHDGTLLNSFSGLCASMRSVKAEATPTRIRVWFATGFQDDIYLAFFNLDEIPVRVSVNLVDTDKVVPGIVGRYNACTTTEEWSSIYFGEIKLTDTLSTEVAPHGTALMCLVCYY